MPSYKGHRYPVEIINHCVWLYFRFPLSFREVEELMLLRGVVVSYETIRRWCAKFGQAYANQLRRRRAQPGDRWHLDEVFIRINDRTTYYPPRGPAHDGADHASASSVAGQVVTGVGRDAATR
jgi:putative transposase